MKRLLKIDENVKTRRVGVEEIFIVPGTSLFYPSHPIFDLRLLKMIKSFCDFFSQFFNRIGARHQLVAQGL